ncbi:hypothetical protein J4732_22350 [Serratia marcescens]|uniref:Uncharacterized protein n=1 Tax=Serratia marcescens TaxID=615 RepID=A0A939SVK2_SERMA|nr:hypothetical protein [Serratia marcescens]
MHHVHRLRRVLLHAQSQLHHAGDAERSGPDDVRRRHPRHAVLYHLRLLEIHFRHDQRSLQPALLYGAGPDHDRGAEYLLRPQFVAADAGHAVDPQRLLRGWGWPPCSKSSPAGIRAPSAAAGGRSGTPRTTSAR